MVWWLDKLDFGEFICGMIGSKLRGGWSKMITLICLLCLIGSKYVNS